jgi:hypothetical protein
VDIVRAASAPMTIAHMAAHALGAAVYAAKAAGQVVLRPPSAARVHSASADRRWAVR